MISAKELDKEWVDLIIQARDLGIPIHVVREYLSNEAIEIK
ncbi:DNA-binding anti-repressor SinI [Virgibacillus sp. W0181]